MQQRYDSVGIMLNNSNNKHILIKHITDNSLAIEKLSDSILDLKDNYKVLLKVNGIFILISFSLVIFSSLPLMYAYPSHRHGFEQIIFSLLFYAFINHWGILLSLRMFCLEH